MNLTRAARSPFADPRRAFTSVLTVMFLVLAILGIQAICGVHPEAGHSSTHSDAAAGHHASSAVLGASGQAADADPALEHGHDGDDPSHCSEERTTTARYDRTLSPFPDLADAPVLAQQWLVPGIAHHETSAPSGLAVAAAPSLLALGISRT